MHAVQKEDRVILVEIELSSVDDYSLGTVQKFVLVANIDVFESFLEHLVEQVLFVLLDQLFDESSAAAGLYQAAVQGFTSSSAIHSLTFVPLMAND